VSFNEDRERNLPYNAFNVYARKTIQKSIDYNAIVKKLGDNIGDVVKHLEDSKLKLGSEILEEE
jgi:hypothetical protein